jgi:membrane-associated phospholipid phosphatase
MKESMADQVTHAPSFLRSKWPLLVIALVAFAASFTLDAWTYHHVHMAKVYDTDWGRALRSVGYWPLWIALAAAIWLHDHAAPRAAFLAASVSAAGLLGEILKILVRRDRPSVADGAYAFRAWSDHPFSSSGFGMPSSHSLIAFSGATALAVLFPRATPIWYALAIGCAITRLLAGAHFLSDVIAGAIIGVVVTLSLRARLLRAPIPGPDLESSTAARK